MDNSIAPKATSKEWIGLIIIALPCIVYAMDLTVLNLAIPLISADLKPKSSELLWIIDIYGFMVAGMLITMGTLGDKIRPSQTVNDWGRIFYRLHLYWQRFQPAQ